MAYNFGQFGCRLGFDLDWQRDLRDLGRLPIWIRSCHLSWEFREVGLDRLVVEDVSQLEIGCLRAQDLVAFESLLVFILGFHLFLPKNLL